MKFLQNAVLAILLCASMFAAPLPARKLEQHKATMTIVMVNEAEHEGAGCSATAIAPHAILTAEHCNVNKGMLYINQPHRPFTMGLVVNEKYFDNNDHMILVVPGVEFKHYIKYEADKVHALEQGEHVYLFGNPDLMADQYREGYVMGTMLFRGSDEVVNASGKFHLIAAPVVGGDSGSAVFAEEDGELVGITTWGIEGGLFLGSYPLQFTQSQIDQAEGVGNFVYVPDTRPQVNVSIAAAKPIVKVYNDNTTLAALFAMFIFFFFIPLFYSTTKKLLQLLWKGIKVASRIRIQIRKW